MRASEWRAGVRDGVPIFLGYLAVSFAFGMQAAGAGLSPLEAAALSVLNLTSAGQFAGLSVIAAGAGLAEMALTQLVVNLRYLLMSCALSQKLDRSFPAFHRPLMAYGVTDEVFSLSACRAGPLSPFYTYGLISAAMPGWGLGTLLGAVSGTLLPANVVSALGVALYGMFIAIVVPAAKRERAVLWAVGITLPVGVALSKIPGLSSGFRIILATVLVAGFCAWKFPVREGQGNAK